MNDGATGAMLISQSTESSCVIRDVILGLDTIMNYDESLAGAFGKQTGGTALVAELQRL